MHQSVSECKEAQKNRSRIGEVMDEQRYYAYRLTFRFARTGIIALDEDNATAEVQMVWEPGGSPHCLISCGASLHEADQFQLSQGNFQSAEEAWEIARRDARALCILAAELGVGVDISPVDIGAYSSEKAKPGTLQFSPHLFASVEHKHNAQTVAQKRGVTVIQQAKKDEGFVSVGVKDGRLETSSLSPHGLQMMLSIVDQQEIQLDDRASLALEIFNSSFFESSVRAQFLTLIQMLEILSTRQIRSTESLDHVCQLKKLTKDAIARAKSELRVADVNTLTRMMSTLGDLKNESITQAIQRVVAETFLSEKILQMTPSDFIKHCYKARSELTHDGTINLSAVEFSALLHSMRQVCLRVLRKVIGYDAVEIPTEAKGPVRLLGALVFTEVAPSLAPAQSLD